MPSSVRIVVTYPRAIVLEGLRLMLDKPGIRIVGEAATGADAILLCKKLNPGVLLLDALLSDSDSFAITAILRETLSDTRCVLLSAIENPTPLARAHAAGAASCLFESVTEKELIAAIKQAADGKAATAGPFAEIVKILLSPPHPAAIKAGLTPRQAQVLTNLAYGLTNEEISRSLGITVSSVAHDVKNILRVLEVKDRLVAAVRAIKSGWA
jgi:DNA-binding NarL/FixJ family response regulator